MVKGHHIIHRQLYEVEVHTGDNSVQIQARLSRLHHQQLQRMIEEVLDEGNSSDRVLQFDRLEIDLGNLRAERWEKQLMDKLRVSLQKALGDAGVNASKTPFKMDGDLASRPHLFKDQEQKKLHALLYFLAHGQLPWWCKELPDLKQLWPLLLQESSGEIKEHLLIILQENSAVERLLHHLPPSQVESLWHYLLEHQPAIQPVFKQVESLLQSWAFETGQSAGRLKSTFYRNIIRITATTQTNQQLSNDFIYRIIAKAISMVLQYSADKSKTIDLAKFLAAHRDKNLKEAKWFAELKSEFKKAAAEQQAKVVKLPSHTTSKQDSARELVQSPAPFLKADPEEAIVVAGAGIVLLHPYLSQFFRIFRLLNKKKEFASEKAQTRAIHLLHFLVFNQSSKAEYKLSLFKLLCNYPLEEPIPMQFRHTAKIKATAQELLRAAVKNWAALKNTSPQGLQQAFLQREGLLYLQDDKLLIRIERQTHDILLDRLPYAIGIFRLPWLNTMVHVEW